MNLEQLVATANRNSLLAMGLHIATKLIHHATDEELRGAVLKAVDGGVVTRVQATDALELYTRTTE